MTVSTRKNDSTTTYTYADDAANHLGDDEHVAEVGLDDGGLLVRRGLLLGLAELLDQAHGLALEAALETATGASMDELDELLVAEVEEVVEFDAPVGELAEGAALLEVGSLQQSSVSGASCVGYRRSASAPPGDR